MVKAPSLLLGGLTLLAAGCLNTDCPVWYLDGDGDGYTSEATELTCLQPDGGVREASDTPDCDDSDAGVNPGVALDGLTSDGSASCDGLDQDCDGDADEDAPTADWYADADGDGYGAGDAVALSACAGQQGYAQADGDCDDTDGDWNPDAAEAACGPEADDRNCDGVTDCAIATASPSTVTLVEGAGRALDAGLDADGDGRGDVLVGGVDAAWVVGFDDGRAGTTEVLDPGFSEGDDWGADVALLPDLDDDGLAEQVIGGPGYDDPTGGTYGIDVGRAAIPHSEGAEVAWLQGGGKDEAVGGLVADSVGLLAVGRTLSTSSGEIDLVRATTLPGPGDVAIFDDGLTADATISVVLGADQPSAVAVAEIAGGWLVAVGQPEDDAAGDRVKVVEVGSDGASTLCSVNVEADATSVGAAVLLADVTGDHAVDLIAGAPDAGTVYIFADAAACDGDLSVADAVSITGDAPSFGGSLAAVPDLNGDRADDLVIGGDGGASLVLGGDSPEVYLSLTGDAGFGAAVAGADLDGDGYGDVIVGDPSTGEIRVYWGGP